MQSLKCGGDGAEIPVESDESSQPSVDESPSKPQPKPRSSKRLVKTVLRLYMYV